MDAIKLTAPKEITVSEPVKRTISTLTVLVTLDRPKQKVVQVILEEAASAPINLWEGAAYDQIGQWTDDDVTARLKEIFGVA